MNAGDRFFISGCVTKRAMSMMGRGAGSLGSMAGKGMGAMSSTLGKGIGEVAGMNFKLPQMGKLPINVMGNRGVNPRIVGGFGAAGVGAGGYGAYKALQNYVPQGQQLQVP